jgi:hypothetical protein
MSYSTTSLDDEELARLDLLGRTGVPINMPGVGFGISVGVPGTPTYREQPMGKVGPPQGPFGISVGVPGTPTPPRRLTCPRHWQACSLRPLLLLWGRAALALLPWATAPL